MARSQGTLRFDPKIRFIYFLMSFVLISVVCPYLYTQALAVSFFIPLSRFIPLSPFSSLTPLSPRSQSAAQYLP